MKKILWALCLFPAFLYAQNIPKIGNDTLLDIAAWNIEWFGDATNGPSNETLQYNNVKAVITKSDMDVWGIEEMSNPASFTSLSNDLPAYGSVNSTFSQTQKMCLFYKKSMFNFINAEHILATSNYDFASRQPLMVTLATKGDSLKIDTIYFIVVHLKANSDATAAAKLESYNRRKRAADALKTFIETTLSNKKYFIMGDWNDRLDFSIHNGADITPFKQLLDAKYNFITKPLADAGKRSYAFSDGFIDHMLIAPRMDSFYVKQSAGVLDNLGQYISNFSNNTTDHYPIYGRFLMNRIKYSTPLDSIPNDTLPTDTLPTDTVPNTSVKTFNNLTFNIYPNPNNGSFFIESNKIIIDTKVEIYNSLGQLIFNKPIESKIDEIKLSNFTSGIYFVKINSSYFIIRIQ
jgi:exonuclease III